MRFLLAQPSTGDLPAGVFGHSQGGWIGAIVAREVPGTAFYVNFAGNGSPGWAQWRHGMTTWLHRKQVPLDQMDLAGAYFDSFFGVYHQQIEWSDYVVALARSREEEWWPVMKQRYSAEWESETEAREYAAAETTNVPADDFEQVIVPTLGLFFEHDHSTTLDTPHIFLEALTAGGNGDVTVRVFPGGDHGAWVVDGFRGDRSQITRRLREPYEHLRDWILAVAAR
jgi:pimeloyl-ACP methyl ester carboxylesterase